MDKTLDRGPMVAATRGIAVEANHHCLLCASNKHPPTPKSAPSQCSEMKNSLDLRESRSYWGRSSLRSFDLSRPEDMAALKGRAGPDPKPSAIVISQPGEVRPGVGGIDSSA